MKTTKTKTVKIAPPATEQKTMYRLRQDTKAVQPPEKAKARENTFSKSRDTREDRGTRQAKSSQKSQTLSRGR